MMYSCLRDRKVRLKKNLIHYRVMFEKKGVLLVVECQSKMKVSKIKHTAVLWYEMPCKLHCAACLSQFGLMSNTEAKPLL